MDKPANHQSNPPPLDNSATMPKARPVFRILALVVAAVYFIAASFFVLDRRLEEGALLAFVGFVFVAICVTGYAPFRHTWTKS
jgi:hypothetical protein